MVVLIFTTVVLIFTTVVLILTTFTKLLTTPTNLRQFHSKATFAFQETPSSSTQSKIMADLGLGGDSKVDPELQEFLMLEKQKAQVNAQVTFNEIS
jgi:hypothetical protein